MMKVKITEKGVDKAPVGTVLTFEDLAALPGHLVNKCEVIEGGELLETQALIVNPASVDDLDTPSRDETFKTLVLGLDPETGFSKEGAPKVKSLNEDLEDGQPKFSKAECDDLWNEHAEEIIAKMED